MDVIHAVNRNASPLPRLLSPAVAATLRRMPVVVVIGARQTGKKMLVSMRPVGSARAYRVLDDLDILELARQEPDGLLEEAPRVIAAPLLGGLSPA